MASGVQTVLLRNEFYRDKYRSMIQIVFGMAVALIVSVTANFYLILNRPAPLYFATDRGNLIPMTPLSQPNLAQENLLRWVTEAAVKVYTFDFQNYRGQFQDASRNFTPEGWNEFKTAMERSNTLDYVKDKRLVVSAAPTGSPVISNEGVVAGVYAWKIQMPVLVTYSGANESSTQPLILTMVITRVPTLSSPDGVGISQFVAAAGTSQH